MRTYFWNCICTDCKLLASVKMLLSRLGFFVKVFIQVIPVPQSPDYPLSDHLHTFQITSRASASRYNWLYIASILLTKQLLRMLFCIICSYLVANIKNSIWEPGIDWNWFIYFYSERHIHIIISWKNNKWSLGK